MQVLALDLGLDGELNAVRKWGQPGTEALQCDNHGWPSAVLRQSALRELPLEQTFLH